jgi:hypothetical protein
MVHQYSRVLDFLVIWALYSAKQASEAREHFNNEVRPIYPEIVLPLVYHVSLKLRLNVLCKKCNYNSWPLTNLSEAA